MGHWAFLIVTKSNCYQMLSVPTWGLHRCRHMSSQEREAHLARQSESGTTRANVVVLYRILIAVPQWLCSVVIVAPDLCDGQALRSRLTVVGGHLDAKAPLWSH